MVQFVHHNPDLRTQSAIEIRSHPPPGYTGLFILFLAVFRTRGNFVEFF